MTGSIAPFRERYQRALADPRLRANLLSFQRAWRRTRDAAFSQAADESAGGPDAPRDVWVSARRSLVHAKEAALATHPATLEEFTRQVAAAGGQVHAVWTASDARDLVLSLLQERGARLLAKGKSMVGEEVFLNQHLEAAGVRVVETDLGEWIVQLAHETPSHMVMPAIHKSRQQVAALFTRETGREVPAEDVPAQVAVAREELRRAFLAADAGLIGANALIAESGTVMLVTNEGNGDLVSTLPRTLIVIAGWEKVVPTFADAVAQLRLLARSATAQPITSYTSFLTGAEPGRELHVVLLDNGRSEMHADPAFRSALRCIRCAACADVCPPYQVVGGHVFGYVYSGAIGLVNTPFHHGLDAAAGPQSLCVSCHACATVCPVEIPLPRQILDVRARVAQAKGLPWPKRLALTVWARPGLFDRAARAAALAQRPFRRGRFLRLPLPRAYRWRSVPALASRPARDDLLGRTFEPDTAGPWVLSKARGLTVAYVLQCLTDRLAPEQARAAIRLLQACGVRVVVPAGQHCCGLPHLDAGDVPTARRLARDTISVLERQRAASGFDYVVTAATSCAVAILHDYAHLLRDDPSWAQRATALAGRTLDLLSFLDRVADPPPLDAPAGTSARATPAANERVAFHSFCQSTNVLGIGGPAGAGPRLLRRVGWEVADLPEGEVCCGFGGTTSLDHPAVGQAIAERKLANVASTGATLLATDNPGCILHLGGAAHAAGAPLKVQHVVELLAERVPGTAAAEA